MFILSSPRSEYQCGLVTGFSEGKHSDIMRSLEQLSLVSDIQNFLILIDNMKYVSQDQPGHCRIRSS